MGYTKNDVTVPITLFHTRHTQQLVKNRKLCFHCFEGM